MSSSASRRSKSILAATANFPPGFAQGESTLIHNSDKTDLNLWCTKEGFSGLSADGSGFYVPNQTQDDSVVGFVKQSVHTSQNLTEDLQTIYDQESIVYFEMHQAIERALNLLKQVSATDFSLEGPEQNPPTENPRTQRTKRTPSLNVDKDDSKPKQVSATDVSTDTFKSEIRRKFKDKALYFKENWGRDCDRLKQQMRDSQTVQDLLDDGRWSDHNLNRFVRCAYGCHARAQSGINWDEIVEFVVAK
jgi:hypothetical protein